MHCYEKNNYFDGYFALISRVDRYLNCSKGEGYNSSLVEFIYAQEKKGPEGLMFVSQNLATETSFYRALQVNIGIYNR